MKWTNLDRANQAADEVSDKAAARTEAADHRTKTLAEAGDGAAESNGGARAKQTRHEIANNTSRGAEAGNSLAEIGRCALHGRLKVAERAALGWLLGRGLV